MSKQAISQLISRRDLVQSALPGAVALAALGMAWPVWAQAPERALPKPASVLRLPDVTLLDGRLWRAL